MSTLLNKRSVVGLTLCVLILSASIPMLLGLRTSPYRALYGNDVLTLTQVTTDIPLNSSLIAGLEALDAKEEWIDGVSPEVYVFCVIDDRPVVVRGVNTSSFLKLEGASLSQGVPNGERTALIGDGLSTVLGLGVGDRVVVTGSTTPSFAEFTLSGSYASPNPSNDEMLISLEEARKLAGMGDDSVMAIRVRTDDSDALVRYLEENDIQVVVSGGGGVPDVLNSNVTYDSRLLNLLFEYSDESFGQDLSLTTAFINQGVSSVSVVIMGFIALNGGLTFVGVVAILARAVIEKKREIGILSAIGASKGNIRLILLKDILLITMPTIVAGIALGLALAYAIGTVNLVVVFGHSIDPALDWTVALSIGAAVAAVSALAGLILNERVLRSRPGHLIQETGEDLHEPKGLEEVLS